MATYLDFEKPIAELEAKIVALRAMTGESVNIAGEVATLEAKTDQLLKKTYRKLTAWQKTQVARHPDRPHFSDYINELIEDFMPLAGDRAFSDDPAIIGGLGRFQGRAVMVIGNEKGTGTEGRLEHNFGMARPEGYRKAARLMRMADRFKRPVITFVDTPGAYPGVGAEERGQSEAIARCTETCLAITVPLIACIVGEGGSGGAVALATGNRVLMLENAIYSVISPEGCASILWRSGDKAKDAAEALKLTAGDLMKLAVIDEIVKEPLGGAHRKPKEAIDAMGKAIAKALDEMIGMAPEKLREDRRDKFLAMGAAK